MEIWAFLGLRMQTCLLVILLEFQTFPPIHPLAWVDIGPEANTVFGFSDSGFAASSFGFQTLPFFCLLPVSFAVI